MADILKIEQFINPVSGFFKYMDYDFEFISKDELDVLFFVNYGDKNPAPTVTKLLSLTPTVIELTNLASVTKSVYYKKWDRLKSLLTLEYDPIHNYKDVLTEEVEDVGVDNVTETLSSESTRNVTGDRSNTRTDNLTNSIEKEGESTTNSNTNDGIFGFNSSEASDSNTSTNVGSTTDTLSNVETSTGTQTITSEENQTFADTKSNDTTSTTTTSNNRSRTSTHSGNIGNLTTQQLMKQEIELWNWNFMQTVLTDVKEFLTIPVYLS